MSNVPQRCKAIVAPCASCSSLFPCPCFSAGFLEKICNFHLNNTVEGAVLLFHSLLRQEAAGRIGSRCSGPSPAAEMLACCSRSSIEGSAGICWQQPCGLSSTSSWLAQPIGDYLPRQAFVRSRLLRSRFSMGLAGQAGHHLKPESVKLLTPVACC